MKTRIKLLSICTLMITSMSMVAQTTTTEKKVQETLNTFKKTTEDASSTVNQTKSGISTVYGDSKEGISTVYNDVKSFGPKIEETVKELTKGLKVGAENVWKILVKQQLVWSWCYLLGIIITIGSWINFYYRFKKYTEQFEVEDSEGWTFPKGALCVVLFMMSVGLSVMSIIHVEPMMTGFINPEFGAMRNIVQIASSLK